MGAKYDAAEIGARVRDRRLTAGLTERDLASTKWVGAVAGTPH